MPKFLELTIGWGGGSVFPENAKLKKFFRLVNNPQVNLYEQTFLGSGYLLTCYSW